MRASLLCEVGHTLCPGWARQINLDQFALGRGDWYNSCLADAARTFGRQSARIGRSIGIVGRGDRWEAFTIRGVACHDDPARRFCSGCHHDIRSNRRLGILLRPHLKNRRRCSGRTYIRLGRRVIHVRAGFRFSAVWRRLLSTNRFSPLAPRSSRNSAPDSDARYLGGVAAQAEPVEIGGQVLFKIMVVSFLPKT